MYISRISRTPQIKPSHDRKGVLRPPMQRRNRCFAIILAMTEADLYNFLLQCKLGVLSTVGGDNLPQSALLGIAVTHSLEIVFDTVKSSRKYPNLIARPGCSFVIGWRGEQTVQYEGRADELSEPELHRFQRVYFDTWPECRAHLSWPGIAYFVVRPRWIRYSDFGQTPPLIREFKL